VPRQHLRKLICMQQIARNHLQTLMFERNLMWRADKRSHLVPAREREIQQVLTDSTSSSKNKQTHVILLT
jgi:hypothetical protein